MLLLLLMMTTTSSMVLLSLLVVSGSTTTARVMRVVRILVWRRHGLSSLQVHVDASGVVFGAVLEPELAAHLLDAGLELLYVIRAVVALAHNPCSRVCSALSKHIRGA